MATFNRNNFDTGYGIYTRAFGSLQILCESISVYEKGIHDYYIKQYAESVIKETIYIEGVVDTLNDLFIMDDEDCEGIYNALLMIRKEDKELL